MNTIESLEHEDKTFEKINYQDKTVSGRKFISCIFKRCNLGNTVFKDCLFDDCIFEECDLSMMKVKGSTFKKLQLIQSKAIGIHWFDTRNSFSIQCTGTNLNYCSFYGQDLKKAKFINCTAREVDFTDCILTEAIFAGTDLEDAVFMNCNLSLADFRGAKNYCFDVRENEMKKTKCSLPEALSLLNYFDIILD